MNKVKDALADGYTQRRVEVVGPAVSSELRTTGIMAVLAGFLALVAYVWFRFEWQFALGTIIALTHDVLVTAGIFSLFSLDFDLSTVAALLTILGYSVNDTVVVSDRIRENLRKYKKMELNDLLNLSLNETLSRTILTGMTAIAVLLALYIFGGEVIRNFTFAMLFGVLIGTYSSMFIAAPRAGLPGGQAQRRSCGAKTKPRPQRPSRRGRPRPRRARRAADDAMADPAHYPGRAPIDAYGNGGFRFADMSHRGSLLCPAERHLCLGRRHVSKTLTPANCAAFLARAAGGAPAARHRAELIAIAARARVRALFAEAGIGLEAMWTGAACRTYNVLLAEGRDVGAASDRRRLSHVSVAHGQRCGRREDDGANRGAAPREPDRYLAALLAPRDARDGPRRARGVPEARLARIRRAVERADARRNPVAVVARRDRTAGEARKHRRRPNAAHAIAEHALRARRRLSMPGRHVDAARARRHAARKSMPITSMPSSGGHFQSRRAHSRGGERQWPPTPQSPSGRSLRPVRVRRSLPYHTSRERAPFKAWRHGGEDAPRLGERSMDRCSRERARPRSRPCALSCITCPAAVIAGAFASLPSSSPICAALEGPGPAISPRA